MVSTIREPKRGARAVRALFERQHRSAFRRRPESAHAAAAALLLRECGGSLAAVRREIDRELRASAASGHGVSLGTVYCSANARRRGVRC